MKSDKELKQFTKELANYIGLEPNDDFLVDVRDVAKDAFEQGWDAARKQDRTKVWKQRFRELLSDAMNNYDSHSPRSLRQPSTEYYRQELEYLAEKEES